MKQIRIEYEIVQKCSYCEMRESVLKRLKQIEDAGVCEWPAVARTAVEDRLTREYEALQDIVELGENEGCKCVLRGVLGGY